MGATITILRWTARLLSLAWLLFVVLQFLDDTPALLRMRGREAAMFLAMCVMALGLVAAWKWERAAPALVLAAYALFSALEGELVLNWFLAFPALALLYLACARGEAVERG